MSAKQNVKKGGKGKAAKGTKNIDEGKIVQTPQEQVENFMKLVRAELEKPAKTDPKRDTLELAKTLILGLYQEHEWSERKILKFLQSAGFQGSAGLLSTVFAEWGLKAIATKKTKNADETEIKTTNTLQPQKQQNVDEAEATIPPQDLQTADETQSEDKQIDDEAETQNLRNIDDIEIDVSPFWPQHQQQLDADGFPIDPPSNLHTWSE
jgi:hypothetical protein